MPLFSENESPWLTLVQQQAQPGQPAAGLFRLFLSAASKLQLIDSTGTVVAAATDGTNGTNGIDGIDGLPGVDGTNGTNGTNGVGVPVGGTTGQALLKNSNADYDTKWGTVAAAAGAGGGAGASSTVAFSQVTAPLLLPAAAANVWQDIPGSTVEVAIAAGSQVQLIAATQLAFTGNGCLISVRIVRDDGTVFAQGDTTGGGGFPSQTNAYYNQNDSSQGVQMAWQAFDTPDVAVTGYKLQATTSYNAGSGQIAVNRTGQDRTNEDARGITTLAVAMVGGNVTSQAGGVWDQSVGVPALADFTQVDPTPCATFSENAGKALGIQITGAHPAVPNIVGLMKAAPAAPYTLSILCLYSAPKVSYNGVVFGWYDPTTEKFDVCCFEQDNYNYGQTFESQNYTNPTNRAGNSVVGTNPNWTGPIWFHLTDDGTNIKWGYSQDGFNIVPMYTYVKANGYLAGNYTNAFIGIFPDGEAGANFTGCTGLSILVWDEDGEVRSVANVG